MPGPIAIVARWSLLWIALVSMAADRAPVRLITDWYPQPEHGGFYHALIKGYYREAGPDVEILPGGPNAFPIQRIATKAAEFSKEDPSISDSLPTMRSTGNPNLAR